MGKTRDLFKKTGDIKGIFHARMGTVKGRNGRDLTEAEEIKKRWQEQVSHLQSDIPECEVKQAVGSITTNKASGGDGIPLELFQILRDDAVKVLTQYASKFGKFSSGHRTGKGQFSFQSQRKAMQKNVQATALISHASKVMLKILQARLQQYVNHELPDVQV